jgi:hypothetical protein
MEDWNDGMLEYGVIKKKPPANLLFYVSFEAI